jgi:hypothetical protein
MDIFLMAAESRSKIMEPKRRLDFHPEPCKKTKTSSFPYFFTLNKDLTGLVLEFLFPSRKNLQDYLNFRLTSRKFRDITDNPVYFVHLKGLLESCGTRKATLYFLKRFGPYLKEIDLIEPTHFIFLNAEFRKYLNLYKNKIVGIYCTVRGYSKKSLLNELTSFENLKKVGFVNLIASYDIPQRLAHFKKLEEIHFDSLKQKELTLHTLPTWRILKIGDIRIKREDINFLLPIGQFRGQVYNGKFDQNGIPAGEGRFFNRDGTRFPNS